MPSSEPKAGLSRRQLIKRGAVVGGAALWVPPVIQSVRLPASAQQVGSPRPRCIVDGFMTGGGFVTVNGVKVSYELRKLDCPPQVSPPELQVSWQTGSKPNKVNYEFELTAFTSRTCLDTTVPNGPEANFDTVVGSGTGTLTIDGVPQNGSIDFEFLDAGEGPSAGDTVSLVIRDAGGNVVLNVADQLVDGGNLQAHDGNFAFGDACPP